MNKKFLSTALALAMILGSFQVVYATEVKEMPTTDKKVEAIEGEAKKEEIKEEKKAEEVKEEAKEEKKAEEVKEETKKEETKKEVKSADDKIKYLVDNKIVLGRTADEDLTKTDLALDATIQRAEITRLLIHIINKTDDATKMQAEKGMFADVPESYWANGVINVASKVKSPANDLMFIAGYEDGTFKPYKPVSLEELAKMLVVITKTDLTNEQYEKANANWPTEWVKWAEELGLLNGVEEKDLTKDASRKDAFVMLYNAMEKMDMVKAESLKNEIKDEVKKEENKIEEKINEVKEDAKKDEVKTEENKSETK